MTPEDLQTPEWQYKKIGWQERQERIPNDYGPSQRSNGPEVKFEDWERSPEHLAAKHF